jgi:hypothetical protein
LDEKEREREMERAQREQQQQQQQQKEGGEDAFGGNKAAAAGEFDAEETAVGSAETDSERDTEQARIRRDWATAVDTDADDMQQLHREGVGTIRGVGY